MKKSIAIALACTCACLTSPALATTHVVTDTIDVRNSYGLSHNAGEVQIGRTTPLEVFSGDIVKGTIWFVGGHIQAVDPARFLMFGYAAGYQSYTEIIDKKMSLLNGSGHEFGEGMTFPQNFLYPGNYANQAFVGANNPGATGSFDVYGIRYEISYGRTFGTFVQSATLRFDPIVYSGRYAEGDIFSSAVPEPSSWAMMAMGFAGLALTMRRRRAAEATVHA